MAVTEGDARRRKQVSGGDPTDASGKRGGDGHDASLKSRLGDALRIWILLALFFAGVFGFVMVRRHMSIPRPVPDTASTLGAFSEERARAHVSRLVDGFGVRMVGMPSNEADAPKYIASRIAEIVSRADPRHVTVETEVQVDSGAFHMDFLGGLTMAYGNVTNVIVRVSRAAGGKDGKSTSTDSDSGPGSDSSGSSGSAGGVLINSHYDSALSSPGAMDAAASVGVMLEVLRVLVLHAGPPPDDAPYVFVFNGGEEALMTGAHAFAEHHRWAKECRYIINMDSCGAGGRGIVFQAGPGHAWLMDLYARVAPHPYGSVVAQDIFLSEVIPSDTDYRVYRDELGVRGFDIAYFENGYVYHTQIDDMRFIGTGSLQHEGDNVVALAKALAAETESDHPAFPNGDPHANEVRPVFYDVVGLYMVSYTATQAAWGHAAICVAIVAAWWIAKGRQGRVGRLLSDIASPARLWAGASAYLVSFPISIGLSAVSALLLSHVFSRPMIWFSSPGLAVVCFLPPSLLGVVIAHARLGAVSMASANEQRETDGKGIRKVNGSGAVAGTIGLAVGGAVAFWIGVLVLMTAAGLGSAYLAAHWVVWPAISGAIAVRMVVSQQRPASSPAREGQWLIVVAAVGFVPPLVLTADVAVSLLELFVPLTGRLGHAPADLIVAAIVALLTSAMCAGPAGLVHLGGTAHLRTLRNTLAIVTLVGLVLMASVGPDPYTSDRPKRLFVEHVMDRTGAEPASHIVLSPMDATGFAPLERHLVSRAGEGGFREPDKLYLNYLFPVSTRLARHDVRMFPAPPPPIAETRLTATACKPPGAAVKGSASVPSVRRVHVTVTPPNKAAAYATVKVHGSGVVRWSFTDPLPPRHVPHPVWEPEVGAPFLHLRRSARDGTPWSMWVDVDVDSDASDGLVIEVTSTEQRRSQELELLAKELPPWATVATWLADMAKVSWSAADLEGIKESCPVGV